MTTLLPQDTRTSILFFDDDCLLCNHFVQWIIRKDKKKQFKFAPLQGSTAKNLIPDHFREPPYFSVVLKAGDKLFIQSKAVVECLKRLNQYYNFIGHLVWLIPYPIRDGLYSLVSKHRYKWFGRKSSCALVPDHSRDRFLD